MNKQFKTGEKYSPPEMDNVEEIRLYNKFQEAENEEYRIMAEIDMVFKSTKNRLEAEKIVIEKLAPLMDEAKKKSSAALKQWLEALRKY
mgnify:CR=1 FL=1